MTQLPDQHELPSPLSPPVRVVHIDIQPKSWWGRLIAGLIGVAVMLAAFFFSVAVFFGIAVTFALLLLYFFLKTAGAGRKPVSGPHAARRDRD